MTTLPNLKALISSYEAAERDQDTLATFIAKGGESRLTLNVEAKSDILRSDVERILEELVNPAMLLRSVVRLQEQKVARAYAAVAQAGLDMGMSQSLKDAAQ